MNLLQQRLNSTLSDGGGSLFSENIPCVFAMMKNGAYPETEKNTISADIDEKTDPGIDSVVDTKEGLVGGARKISTISVSSGDIFKESNSKEGVRKVSNISVISKESDEIDIEDGKLHLTGLIESIGTLLLPAVS